MKHSRRLKRTAFGGILLTSTVLLFMMMAGNALAATDPVFIHGIAPDGSPDPLTRIILRGPDGLAISNPGDCNPATAFSAKETCGYCHNGGPTPCDGTALLSYDEIEQHSYHAQLGVNQITGWGGPTATKPWVQSPAHVGNW